MSRHACASKCFACCEVGHKAPSEEKSAENGVRIDQIPPQYGSLLRAWVKLQTEAGADRFELASGIEEIVEEFRNSGDVVGAEFLRFWTRLLREQTTAHSGC